MNITGTGFGFRVESAPDGFTVSATADRAPVTVTMREWAWTVDLGESAG